MSNTNYGDILVGDVVYFTTPQEQTGKGKAIMMGTYGWVIDRGNGQPHVVTPENFVKFNKGRNRREDFLGKFLNGGY